MTDADRIAAIVRKAEANCCNVTIDEIRWLADRADRPPEAVGVIAWAHYRDGELSGFLRSEPEPRDSSARSRFVPLIAALPPAMTGRYHKVLRVSGKNAADNWLSWLTDEEKAEAMKPEPLPPDPAPTGERRPCVGWRDVGFRSVLEVNRNLIVSVSLSNLGPTWCWFVNGTRDGAKPTRDEATWCWFVNGTRDGAKPTRDEAKLAAEDAAAELLRAGLRALGLAK